MKKFSLIVLWALILVMLCGCGNKVSEQKSETDTPATDQTAQTEVHHDKFKNPLTGEYTLENESDTKIRPVAVSVNNQHKPRTCQTGLESADIIYESYVEGGITRLLAIYKDISKVGEIGSIRSARYDFVNLCLGHDAIYIHAGVDYTYCQPYIEQIGMDDANLLLGSLYGYVYRLDNGLALEHTLYGKGESLDKMLTDKGWRKTVKDSYASDWQNFNETAQKLSGGSAQTITAKFSGDYTSIFDYNAETGVYEKRDHKDWRSGNAVSVKNVVVLFTPITEFSDGYRVKIHMDSGHGYYFSNGTYQKINWSKGDAENGFKFTDEDGKVLGYNPGNSWVCIVSKDMEGAFSYQ